MKLKLADPSTEVRRQISSGHIYLLFLSVAAVLFAAEIVAQQREMQEDDRWLVRAWVVLFVVMFFNASVSGMIRVHLAVIPLTIVALLHIRRACRIEQLAA